MKIVGIFGLGILLAVVSLTLLSSTSFVGVAALYGGLLYYLFYARDRRNAHSLVLGATLGLELLGEQHFGLATAFAVFLWLLHQLLGVQTRFTSLYARYIVALLILLPVYALAFFPLAGLVHRLIILSGVAVVIILIGLYRTTSQPGSEYEFI